jgi:large subunit ribosomal protein L29
MKKDKLKALDPAEMENKLREIDEQSFRVKFQMSMGQNEGLKRLRENRKDRARLLTWLRQGEMHQSGLRADNLRSNNPGRAK